RATAMATTDRRMRFMVNLLLFAGRGRLDHLPPADAARGHEREGAVVERGREIPGVRRDILRPRLVRERRQDELARQWEVAQLNPYLPVQSFLPKRVVPAGDAADLAGPDVHGRGDRFGLRLGAAPAEQ